LKTLGLVIGSGDLPWQLDWQPDGSATTPYGDASMVPQRSRFAGVELIMIKRHGVPHHLAPHAINYRANLTALAERSVEAIIAVNTVGGIGGEATSGSLHLAEQLIDYTWGRLQTFSPDDAVRHVDFSHPYDARLNHELAAAASAITLPLTPGATMAVTQGPRLETAAEIRRLAQDGATLVGMTGMPEAALARELAIPFASLCLVVNRAAGLGESDVLDLQQIQEVSAQGMRRVGDLLLAFLERLR
jgi:purine nucleoside phosphorylase